MRLPAMPGPRRTSPRLAVVAVVLTAIAVTACPPDPVAQADAAQLITEMSEAIAQLQQDNAALQAQVDSLRIVAARQDTLIARLAAVTGVPIPPR